ncbi:hypothetical protein PVAG01_09797 [Phlyctema vagabunda]|uniref:Uncharacterized protein n=1 Tax=Phlyctema vagabunda TaxID=108571 RepID=A0ABR4P430_9HELO
MKSFTPTIVLAITALSTSAYAQGTTVTGFGIGPLSGSTQFQNQSLFQLSNASPNYTKSVSLQASTQPAETWSWAVNVTSISNAVAQTQTSIINTVLSLTWPEQTTANSVCAVAVNGAPLTYTTNPGDDGSCATVLQGCIADLTTSVANGMVSADGTAQCGTAFTNISIPASCSSYFSAGSAGLNVSASPLGNLQSGEAWLYSTNINFTSASALDDTAERVWPVFLMRTSGSNVTSFAEPKCLQARASEASTPTSTDGTPSATGDAASATSTNAAPRAKDLSEVKGVAALVGSVVAVVGILL